MPCISVDVLELPPSGCESDGKNSRESHRLWRGTLGRLEHRQRHPTARVIRCIIQLPSSIFK